MTVIALQPPASPINYTYFMPGSKSFTNRALVMAALADGGSTVLRHASRSDDSEAMMNALRKFGVVIDESGSSVTVTPPSGGLQPFEGEINVGPAGTTMRFLTALCSIVPGATVELLGSERMHQRPIGSLVEALRSLGAKIEYLNTKGCPPLRVSGAALKGSATSMEGAMSSQYFTALLLTSPALPTGLKLQVLGDQISKSYIDMTIQSMRRFGVVVQNHDYSCYTTPAGARYTAGEYDIEGDASGASYLWGAAALSGGTVRVQNISTDSVQGDALFPSLLEKMGCTVRAGQNENTPFIEVTGSRSLSAIEADMTLLPDTAQTLAVIAATAKGTTLITGLSTLKHKETDRLEAMKTELAKIGISCTVTDDSISIEGNPDLPDTLEAEPFDTYEDHRMAMSLAVLASRFSGIHIREPEVVSKSFPDFWNIYDELGVASI